MVLRQKGDGRHHEAKYDQCENDGSADFILFWFSVVFVIV